MPVKPKQTNHLLVAEGRGDVYIPFPKGISTKWNANSFV